MNIMGYYRRTNINHRETTRKALMQLATRYDLSWMDSGCNYTFLSWTSSHNSEYISQNVMMTLNRCFLALRTSWNSPLLYYSKLPEPFFRVKPWNPHVHAAGKVRPIVIALLTEADTGLQIRFVFVGRHVLER